MTRILNSVFSHYRHETKIKQSYDCSRTTAVLGLVVSPVSENGSLKYCQQHELGDRKNHNWTVSFHLYNMCDLRQAIQPLKLVIIKGPAYRDHKDEFGNGFEALCIVLGT